MSGCESVGAPNNDGHVESDQDFSYPILVCTDFERLLRREGQEVSVDELSALALRRGRVLLQAPGGTGKTWTLSRLKSAADRAGTRCSVLNLGARPSLDIDLAQPETLFSLAEPPITEGDLPEDEPVLLLVDGLAEVSRRLAAGVLEAVDQWAADLPRCGAIVADRMSRRDVDGRKWVLATLGPVPAEDIRRILGRGISQAEFSLLSTPIFLNLVAQTGAAQSSSELLGRELSRANLDSGQRQTLADFALGHYAAHHRRPFAKSDLVEALGKDAVHRLDVAGLLAAVDVNNTISFSHHLIHDYLAASSAANHPETWRGALFDELTLFNSSPESLLFLLELTEPELRAGLVRSVYDWNLYAAAFLLSNDQQLRGGVDAVTEYEVLALLGERQFDHFLASRRQVTDALVLHGGPVAKGYLAAQSPSEVIELAAGFLADNSDYIDWLSLFTCEQRPTPMFVLERLDDVDGVDGWTAANVVRRLGLDDSGVKYLVERSSATEVVVRWRAAHALGVARSQLGQEALFRLFTSDPAMSVRYGALRSIVDHAYFADTAVMRRDVFSRLASHEQALRESPSLGGEFARVLEVASPPNGWAEAASVVIAALLANETHPERLEAWRLLNADLRAMDERDDQ